MTGFFFLEVEAREGLLWKMAKSAPSQGRAALGEISLARSPAGNPDNLGNFQNSRARNPDNSQIQKKIRAKNDPDF